MIAFLWGDGRTPDAVCFRSSPGSTAAGAGMRTGSSPVSQVFLCLAAVFVLTARNNSGTD